MWSDPVEAFDRFFEANWPALPEQTYGSGNFGRWITDENGLPAYEYGMDHTTDPRATYVTSEGGSRNHWHLLGNDRIVATAHNGGYVQLYDWTRGGKLINRWCPRERNYAGGFKFVRIGEEAFNTLWSGLPKRASQRRVFGMGYFEKVTRYRETTLTERIEAPVGDDPVLVSTTRIENQGAGPIDVTVVEFWDVNPHQLTAGFVMTGPQGKRIQQHRSELNNRFLMIPCWEASSGVLRIDFNPADPGSVSNPNEAAAADFHLKTVFLAALDALPNGYGQFAVDQDVFFQEKDADDPTLPGLRGVADGRLFESRSALGGKAILAIRRTAHLDPGRHVAWRYLYGYADAADIAPIAARHRPPSTRARRPVLELVVPQAPWLVRELLWHSYYLQAGSFYSDFFKAHFVDQGSAYGYLQGLSGAHRDFALFILPMVYLRPDLAKEMLRFSMRSQDANTGALPYAHVGHGMVTGAIIHDQSSDLDLFFLWALSEYLGATQDPEFPKEPVAFYPPSAGKSGTVLEHARAAFGHLVNRVGVGPHGLLRCGSGDWNDVLLAFSDRPMTTRQRGESSLNAGLAAVALPALAGAIQTADASFAEELRRFAAGQIRALKTLWTGQWAARGYLGYGDATLGIDHLFLDTQPFGVLGDVWDKGQLQRLFERLDALCVKPQRVGALSLWPPMKGPFLQPGSDTNGGTWAAIDSWLAWAWSKVDPKAAWDFYLTTTLAARAEAYPNVWYGVWSGPDSYNAHYHARPGETFNLNATPMTDFPVMNMNRHSGPLLDAVKLIGIGARDGWIVIDPRVPFDSFVIRLPLIGAAYVPGNHRGYYTPVVAGAFRFAVRCPSATHPSRLDVTVNGSTSRPTIDADGFVRFEATGQPGRKITWEIKSP